MMIGWWLPLEMVRRISLGDAVTAPLLLLDTSGVAALPSLTSALALAIS